MVEKLKNTKIKLIIRHKDYYLISTKPTYGLIDLSSVFGESHYFTTNNYTRFKGGSFKIAEIQTDNNAKIIVDEVYIKGFFELAELQKELVNNDNRIKLLPLKTCLSIVTPEDALLITLSKTNRKYSPPLFLELNPELQENAKTVENTY